MRSPSGSSFTKKAPPPPPSAFGSKAADPAPPSYAASTSGLAAAATKRAPPPIPGKPKPKVEPAVEYVEALFDFAPQVRRTMSHVMWIVL